MVASWRADGRLLRVALLTTSAAQQVGAISFSLALVKVGGSGPSEIASIWMMLSIVTWLSPIVGILSDAGRWSDVEANNEDRDVPGRTVPLCSREAMLQRALAVGAVSFAAMCAVTWGTDRSAYAAAHLVPVMTVLAMVLTLSQLVATTSINGIVVEEGLTTVKASEGGDVRQVVMADLQADVMKWRSLGSLLGSVLQTILLSLTHSQPQAVSLSGCFAVCSIFCCVGERAAGGMRGTQSGEQRAEANAAALGTFEQATKRALTAFWRSAKRLILVDAAPLRFPLLFVVIFCGTPSTSAAYFSFVASHLAYPSWLMALNGSFGLLGALASVYYFKRCAAKPADATGLTFRKVESRESFGETEEMEGGQIAEGTAQCDGSTLEPQPQIDEHSTPSKTMRRCVTIASLLSVAGILSNMVLVWDIPSWCVPSWGFATKGYMVLDEFVLSFVGRFAFLPVLTLAATKSVEGSEASTFELFAFAANVGGVLSSSLSIFLMSLLGVTADVNERSMSLLILCCASLKVIPMLVVRLTD